MSERRTDPRPPLCSIAAALALAGCGSGGGSPGGAAATEATATPAASASATPAGPKQAALGDELTLKGLRGDMKVRVTGIVDPLPSPGTERPKAGRRFVGVRAALTNAGGRPYRDAPLNGSMLVTDPPKAANPTILIGGDCPSKLGTRLRVPAGSSKRLCLPFQVREKARISAFRFRLNSGFGPETGEWAVE